MKHGIILTIVSWLMALSCSRAVLAQDKRGFSPPGTSFGTNPFAARPGAPAAPRPDMIDDEEPDFEDDAVDDISDEILRQRMEQRLRERGSAAGTPPTAALGGEGGERPNRASHRASADFGQAGNDLGANSVTGGSNSKIMPGAKSSGCLKLDPFTGYGPDIITNFDFPDADIVEIAKTLGRLTCLNFLLDKDVKGRISVVSNAPITVGEAWKAFLTALDVNGFSLIPSGAYLRIARQRDAKDKQIKTYSGNFSPNTDLYITRVLALKYISAEEVARVFRNFMPPNTRIISYDQTNTLIITDTGSNIKKIVDMVQMLDVEGFDEGLEVIRIHYASAQEISKLIDALLPGSGGQPSPGGVPRFHTSSGFAARKTKEGGVISHIIPDDRTNSVIVSANAKGLEQVKELIRKLDAKVTATSGGSRIHVVYLQFADAEQVATTISNLTANAGAAHPTTPIPAPGASSAPITTAALFEGSIKISADKPTNSLVITGTPTDFMTVKRVIERLDVARDQVYVEAIIMDMTIDKTFSLGTSIALPSSGIGFLPNMDLANFLQNPLTVTGAVMGFKTGNTTNVPIGNNQTVPVNSVQGLIKAIQSNTNANILATPQLLTLDNQEASIEVSDNIPIQTSTAVPNAGVSTSITYQKVALTLKIKPQINKISNFVKLDIDQNMENLSNTVPSGLTTQAFSTTGRHSKTTVIVQDGDTVAMGGLVRNSIQDTTTKIPLLGDIPILGWLFRNKTTETKKENLIVFMTPQIIKQYQNIRKVLDRKIKERDDYIEKTAGGVDDFQDDKVDMIKRLPPVSDLKNGGRVENADIDGYEDSDKAFEEETPAVPRAVQPDAGPQANGSQFQTIPGPVINGQQTIQPVMPGQAMGLPGQPMTMPAQPQVPAMIFPPPIMPPIDGATAPGAVSAPPQAAPSSIIPPAGHP